MCDGLTSRVKIPGGGEVPSVLQMGLRWMSRKKDPGGSEPYLGFRA
jgi:hypothetical protein